MPKQSLLEQLGLDPENVKWTDLASCLGMEPELWCDIYEKDEVLARQADQVCMGCPVIKQCFKAGRQGKEEGVWGGVFLSNGNVDRNRNKHKSNDDWNLLEELLEQNVQ